MSQKKVKLEALHRRAAAAERGEEVLRSLLSLPEYERDQRLVVADALVGELLAALEGRVILYSCELGGEAECLGCHVRIDEEYWGRKMAEGPDWKWFPHAAGCLIVRARAR